MIKQIANIIYRIDFIQAHLWELRKEIATLPAEAIKERTDLNAACRGAEQGLEAAVRLVDRKNERTIKS